MRKSKPYNIEEHRHRFAVWAASRAASTIRAPFSVEQGKQILEAIGLNPEFTRRKLPSPGRMDARHRQWRLEAIKKANGLRRKFTHGIAAKLINVYCKSRFVCGDHKHPSVDALHPPIDRLLLTALAKNKKEFGEEERAIWREAVNKGWSKCDCDEYEKVIGAIRTVLPGQPLWEIEKYWRGHQ